MTPQSLKETFPAGLSGPRAAPGRKDAHPLRGSPWGPSGGVAHPRGRPHSSVASRGPRSVSRAARGRRRPPPRRGDTRQACAPVGRPRALRVPGIWTARPVVRQTRQAAGAAGVTRPWDTRSGPPSPHPPSEARGPGWRVADTRPCRTVPRPEGRSCI